MSEKPEFNGFDRIVINYEGEAWSYKRAFDVLGITPDVAFRRKDGWVLGAPKEFEHVARRMWEDEWTHIIRKGETEWIPIR